MQYRDKKVLVVGGTGSIGERIVERLLKQGAAVVRIYSRDEYKQFILQDRFSRYADRLRFLLGDIRDYARLRKAMAGVDIVFNLAALKHVPSCEYNPFEAVKTNVIGTQNVIDAAIYHNVERVLYTSSDKAIAPTNTMGATKLLAEKLIMATEYSKGKSSTIFTAVRFGNVMNSRGSVIPLFKSQIISGRYITITEPEMTRFMMTEKQAVDLTLKACMQAIGGEVFILKMPVIRLADLADCVLDLVCKKENIDRDIVKIKKIGLRPGEKMYEELMTFEESKNAFEFEDMFAVIPVSEDKRKYEKYTAKKAEIKEYRSLNEQLLSKEEIIKMIKEYI